jgi:AcrR family transcriptional regulator
MPGSTTRSKHRVRREEQRQTILLAADRFLRTRPYRELSVEALMADTGLTRTSFYRWFGGLPDVVLAMLDTAAVELNAIAATWARQDDLSASAAGALAEFVGFFARHGPVIAAIAQATSYDPEIEERYRATRDRFVAMTQAGLQQLGHANAAQVALALNLMNERFLLEQFGDSNRPGDPEQAAATLEWIWLGAMRPSD